MYVIFSYVAMRPLESMWSIADESFSSDSAKSNGSTLAVSDWKNNLKENGSVLIAPH